MTKYTTPTVRIDQVVNVTSIAVLFYIDTSGNAFCQLKYQSSASVFAKTIDDNKGCYFALVSPPSGVTNQAQFDAAVKGIVDASASNYVISTNGNNIYIKNDIPLTPV
ncbi:unknown [Po-Circo-like virus 21]|uniref:Uncharacterized protein n=1 Tax=Po-Circo-like virus 21 TaxID=1105383 RepID=G8E3X4_9VIRU|nr:unknown [Po-Circo-like virus 21]AER30020.1 unknown [Po-Circo-like virus 21]